MERYPGFLLISSLHSICGWTEELQGETRAQTQGVALRITLNIVERPNTTTTIARRTS